jgi:hypothetical protein
MTVVNDDDLQVFLCDKGDFRTILLRSDILLEFPLTALHQFTDADLVVA